VLDVELSNEASGPASIEDTVRTRKAGEIKAYRFRFLEDNIV
jgi:hypothetical protein